MFGKFKTGNLLSRDFRASPYLYFAALLIFMRRNPEPRTLNLLLIPFLTNFPIFPLDGGGS